MIQIERLNLEVNAIEILKDPAVHSLKAVSAALASIREQSRRIEFNFESSGFNKEVNIH
ncbi:MAG: hypothetical protein GY754_13290 [bacterium]|nr:hypothetical protein [bacterium]